jgi:hypothetical protein
MPTSTDFFCRGYPNEFGIFLDYTCALRFDDKPNYSYLRKLFRDLFIRKGYHLVVGWACTRGKTICYGIKVGACQVSPMREIDHGPCQLIFASSRFFMTPSAWMSPSICRATHADKLNTHIKFMQARICFIFHYYGRFLSDRLHG